MTVETNQYGFSTIVLAATLGVVSGLLVARTKLKLPKPSKGG
jgi:hypothetical protein